MSHDHAAFVSASMRDILIQHVDETLVPIVQPFSAVSSIERERANRTRKSMVALINRGLIRPVKPNGRQTKVFRPTHTAITESGRVALRKVLAEYAEVLTRSGYRVEEMRHQATLNGALVNEPREVIAESTKIPAPAE
jgi:hypothetical protein